MGERLLGIHGSVCRFVVVIVVVVVVVVVVVFRNFNACSYILAEKENTATSTHQYYNSPIFY